MIGKGFSSCLICEGQDNLLQGNQLVVKIVKARYGTDKFDVMLQNTKVCMMCIGRLHQLNEFCAMNQVALPNSNEDTEKIKCDICQNGFTCYEVLPPEKLITEDIDLPKWVQNYEEDKIIVCCFSCYNFTRFYNETMQQLTQLLDYFYGALNKCTVKVQDCSQQEDTEQTDNNNQEEFFGSLLLTPVNNSKRVSFAAYDDIIPQPPTKRQRTSLVHSTPNSLPLKKTESLKNAISVRKSLPRRHCSSTPMSLSLTQTKSSAKPKLRDSIEIMPRRKIQKKTRKSSGNTSGSGFEDLKREYNITECLILLDRLPVTPAKKNSAELTKRPKKKSTIKIKVGAKSKLLSRRNRRSLQNQESTENDNNLNLEVVLTQENLNNSQSSTMSVDPLNASGNEVQKINSSLDDDTLPVISPQHYTDAADNQIRDEDNNNTVSSKENNNLVEVCSTRKTRNSGGKLTESINVPNIIRSAKKRKVDDQLVPDKAEQILISPKKEIEVVVEPEINDYVEDVAPEEELEDNLEAAYLTEIEFLHPQYKNKAVKFESTINNEELELLSVSQENFMSLSTEDLNMNNAEYLEEESLEEIMNTRNSPKNDALCPIYTMDQLLNEDSLLNVS